MTNRAKRVTRGYYRKMCCETVERPRTATPAIEPSRDVTDPRAMRALAHPVRLELLEQLAMAGTLTAAQASERVNETPANCSFHLRILARYGFVEEAGDGRGRARPWRRVIGGIGTPELYDEQDNPEAAATGRALTDIVVNRHLETIRRYRAAVGPAVPPEWQSLGGHTNAITHLTLDELAELRAELIALLTRYAGRSAQPELRPAGSRPVQVFAFIMPRPQDPTAAEKSSSLGEQSELPL